MMLHLAGLKPARFHFPPAKIPLHPDPFWDEPLALYLVAQ